jgi:outer membrane protein assembly factor BamA
MLCWLSFPVFLRSHSILLTLASFLATSRLAAQSDVPSSLPSPCPDTIDSVVVSGNEKTKTYVILDEMTLRPGANVTEQSLEFDRNRIYSLGLFNRVELRCDSLEGRQLLHVDVSERWYIIPLPVFGFAEGDVDKPYYGGGLLHNNFRGRNQKLFGLITFGYNPSVGFSFHDPQTDRENRLYLSAGFSYARVRNKSMIESALTGNFNERHYNISSTLGKRFNLYHTAGLTLGYEMVHISSYRPGRTVSLDGRDQFLFAGASYTYDSRDLREYASTGRFLFFAVTKYGLGDSEVSYTRVNVDTRFYVPLPLDLTLATRTHGTLVSGSFIPTYARAYFGYGERIRGYYDTVFEGEDMAGGSVELRYQLLKPRVIHFTAIPLPPEFSFWRFGISLALFADTGLTWFRGDAVKLSDFSSGYGGGIHFLLPYSAVIRTEYAWNELAQGQFILGIKTSF